MRFRHYFRNRAEERYPGRAERRVCNPGAVIEALSKAPRPALGWFSCWIGFLTTPFKFLGIQGWKETGCDATLKARPVRAAQHSTDGFWTIDVVLESFRIGASAAPRGRFVRLEIEPGTGAHEICEARLIDASVQLELSGPAVIDEDAGGFLEVHPDQDFHVVPPESAGESGRRVAVLVIHGIGEQEPYQTLDAFARGFARHFRAGGHDPLLRPERIRHDGWTEVAVRLEFDKAATPRGLALLGIHEFYWAPYTEGKTNVRSVLSWMARTCLTPLRYFSDNVGRMTVNVRAGLKARSQSAEFLRQLGWAFVSLVPVIAAAFIAIACRKWIVPKKPTLSLSRVMGLIHLTGTETLLLLGTVVFGAFAIVLAVLVGRLFIEPRWRRSPGARRPGFRTYRVLAVASFAVSAALHLFLGGRFIQTCGYFETVAALRADSGIVLLVLWAGAALFLRYVLVKFVGDVALYVNADRKAKSFEVRNKILTEATKSLGALILDVNHEYDEIILAGHSLGSVIAVDLLNEELSHAWAKPDSVVAASSPGVTPQLLDRVKGLVTFGSPLEKVAYFFRERVPGGQPIRAQINSLLHSFRAVDNGRDLGAYAFTYDPPSPAGDPARAVPELDGGFRWLNVWSPFDPISSRLRSYNVADDDQLCMGGPRYWLWGFAHLAYWHDDRFYEFITKELL